MRYKIERNTEEVHTTAISKMYRKAKRMENCLRHMIIQISERQNF